MDKDKKLTEQQVLRKLHIDGFDQLTASTFLQLMSMKNVDPEIIKKAIDQVPQFVELAKEMVDQQKETVEKALQSNDESVRACYESLDREIDILEKMLEKDTLSFEEKMIIVDKITECNRIKCQKDSENKSFLASAVKMVVGGVAVGVMCVVAVPLALAMMGGESTTNTQEEIEQNDNKRR
jgi:hypothetical protein